MMKAQAIKFPIVPNYDDLLQRAADNATARLALFLDALAICAEADDATRGATTRERQAALAGVASHLCYSTMLVGRFAAMRDLPDDLIRLDVPANVYWAALLYSDDPVETLRAAFAAGVESRPELMRFIGVEEEKRLPLFVGPATVVESEPGKLGLEDDGLGEVEVGRRVSVRISERKEKNGQK